MVLGQASKGGGHISARKKITMIIIYLCSFFKWQRKVTTASSWRLQSSVANPPLLLAAPSSEVREPEPTPAPAKLGRLRLLVPSLSTDRKIGSGSGAALKSAVPGGIFFDIFSPDVEVLGVPDILQGLDNIGSQVRILPVELPHLLQYPVTVALVQVRVDQLSET